MVRGKGKTHSPHHIYRPATRVPTAAPYGPLPAPNLTNKTNLRLRSSGTFRGPPTLQWKREREILVGPLIPLRLCDWVWARLPVGARTGGDQQSQAREMNPPVRSTFVHLSVWGVSP